MMTARSTSLSQLVRALPARGIASSSSAHASSSTSAPSSREQAGLEDRAFDEDEDVPPTNSRRSGGSNSKSAVGSLSRTAFVRSADGRIPDIHSALALARSVAFPRREGGLGDAAGEADAKQPRRTLGGSGGASESGPKQESVLRDVMFARSFEQRQYMGYGSLTFSSPETLSSALKAQQSSLTPRKYYVPALQQSSEKLVKEPLMNGRSLAMIGLADVAPLIGLSREEIVKTLGEEHGSAARVEEEGEEEVQQGETAGRWVEYKLERRTSDEPPGVIQAGHAVWPT
ncbi:unnamed protein product [Tilletia controversa]|uniref:Uncharacterized protein n=1 Tax=Tilletia laevis TaxID=157183 RepID=A0A9N8QIE9_9BASI|nr:unnamed protein product [Tilletia caries]CAD6917364.1 unnamed protein product [Tilletia laevis]CAD6945935.1 unnamed protein product [Tilletia laevis]CAD6964392.1 unnamed protein product [Tilletia controversa]CAD6982216.1 unnamed protein product [Tilletia controversa]